MVTRALTGDSGNCALCASEEYMTVLPKIALSVLIIGGLNWLLVGAFHFDLVAALFGSGSTLSRIVYVLVGLCALYCITLLFVPVRQRNNIVASEVHV
jgi:uncharacterized protein